MMIPRGALASVDDDAEIAYQLASLLASDHCGYVRLYMDVSQQKGGADASLGDQNMIVVVEAGCVVAAVCGDLTGDSALEKILTQERRPLNVYQYSDSIMKLARKWLSGADAFVRPEMGADEITRMVEDVMQTAPSDDAAGVGAAVDVVVGAEVDVGADADAEIPDTVEEVLVSPAHVTVAEPGIGDLVGSDEVERCEIEIVVTHKNAPVSDAEVIINDIALHTDTDGRIESWLRTGVYEVSLELAGFAPVRRTIDLTSDVHEDIELLRECIALILVKAPCESGESLPVNGARVTLGTDTAVSDADGIARFNVPPGESELSIEVDGYASIQTILAVNTDSHAEFVLQYIGDAEACAVDLSYFKQIETDFAKISEDILESRGLSHLITGTG